ncbi:response regulator transcription factor [Paractinoplanes maris]|uniref:response regulator transcription factor n=1 Tax=Paractinoplanes maris TaxID=1734446 RepID=UPI0027E05ABC|nr:helix-turn-helix transcriptional regulator [Actinoplanes maris]
MAAWKPLSPRQRQVLWLVAEGCTNAEIAARTGVSPLTVKTHLELLGVKLGATRRAHIVAQGFRAGELR